MNASIRVCSKKKIVTVPNAREKIKKKNKIKTSVLPVLCKWSCRR